MALIPSLRFAALALAVGMVAAPAAFADTRLPGLQLAQNEPSSAEAEAIEPNEEQLGSFVSATVRIIAIQQEAEQDITAAQEPEAQEAVRDQALEMIVAAVEAEGLTVDQYNGIVKHVEADPELKESMQQQIQEKITE